MANVLPFHVRCRVIASLVGGTSIRATAKLHSVDKDAVMKLGVTVGLACLALHARLVKGVQMALGEVDEVWAFVGRHARRMLAHDPPEWGDHYTMFAIDPVTKLVPAYLTGRRDLDTATRFACDLRARTVGKPQITVDGWPHWPEAFRRAYGWAGVDLGIVQKEYENDQSPQDPARRYSPGRVKWQRKKPALGCPREDLMSTSIAERLNLTTRMEQRRLTRLTTAYSKKPENLRAALGLHFMHYNYVRVHESLKTTPAVAAGLASAPWSLAELVTAALEEVERSKVPPTPPEPPSPAPVPPPPVEDAPLPTWDGWREMEQVELPGIDPTPANDTAPEEVDEEGPVTMRDGEQWWASAAE